MCSLSSLQELTPVFLLIRWEMALLHQNVLSEFFCIICQAALVYEGNSSVGITCDSILFQFKCFSPDVSQTTVHTDLVVVKYLMYLWLVLWLYENNCDMLVFLGSAHTCPEWAGSGCAFRSLRCLLSFSGVWEREIALRKEPAESKHGRIVRQLLVSFPRSV